MAGQTQDAAELAEFRKNHNILRKDTIFNEHPVVEQLGNMIKRTENNF